MLNWDVVYVDYETKGDGRYPSNLLEGIVLCSKSILVGALAAVFVSPEVNRGVPTTFRVARAESHREPPKNMLHCLHGR